MLKKIKEVVESISGIPDISIKSRKQVIVFPRYIYYGLAEELTDCSLETTSSINKQDHSTVIHARNEFKKLIEREPGYKDIYQRCKDILTNKNINESPLDFTESIKYYNQNKLLQLTLDKSIKDLSRANSKLESYAHAKDFIELLEGLTPQHIEQAKDRLKPFIAICLSNQKRNSYYLNKQK